MRNLITLILLSFTIGAMAQNKEDPRFVYTSLSFDANMAFGIKDNKDTLKKDRGFDWDLEVGARGGHVAVYLFYGQFNSFDYQIYGTGLDYYFHWLKDKDLLVFNNTDLSLGVYYSQVIREDSNGNHGSFSAWVSPRAQIILWRGDLGLVLKGNLQYRPDLVDYVYEASIGLVFKIDRN